MSAFYPQGMSSYNNAPQNGYKTWKGTGYFKNPVGVTWGNLRPFTNKDIYNNVIYKHGSARPLKQYRKGISVVSKPTSNIYENYQENREVKSSPGTNLVSQLIDFPGCYNAIQNKLHESDTGCKFRGISMVNSVYPNVNYYENPPVIMKDGDNPIFIKSDTFCCSQPKNALRLLRTSTNLKQNYYTTTYQYLQNRCQTYEQRIFNFATPRDINPKLESVDTYVANCLPNFIIKEGIELELIDVISRRLIEYDSSFQEFILQLKNEKTLNDFLNKLYVFINTMENSEELIKFVSDLVNLNSEYLTGSKNCGKVVYKPSNAQFATEGAVTASTYILKKDVTEMEKYDALQNRQNIYQTLNCNNCGTQSGVSNIYKTKTPTCLQNGVCNSVTTVKTYGNRPSRYAYLNPELYNRKFMGNFNNTHQHRDTGGIKLLG